MIVYNPQNERIIARRMEQAEKILGKIPAKHCFISGSFLFKENYNDIDIFVISRRKKKFTIDEKKANIMMIDFNDLYSLFYHTISKSCISKNILPTKPLKVTISDYWHVINEAVPTILNQKNKYHKDIRFLMLYTEYFKTGQILDTFQLNDKIEKIKNYKEILEYVSEEVPKIMKKNMKETYIKRFFYTQAGFYRDSREYESQNYLYNLSHTITRGIAYG
jgi:hypothetical protein